MGFAVGAPAFRAVDAFGALAFVAFVAFATGAAAGCFFGFFFGEGGFFSCGWLVDCVSMGEWGGWERKGTNL
jgi:hypothetical protein